MSAEKFIKNKTVLITLISACLIVIISLGIRQTFGMFYFDFSVDLDVTLSQFGFALGLQMFLWGAFAPWFGVITDKYGGHIAVFIGFIFYLMGILMLVSEYNTGLYFVTGIGVLIGVALGGTAISIPVSVVAKHFPQSNRTAAIGIVTAAGSFGYFLSPVFTKYSLVEYGWESTLLIFAAFLLIGLILAFYLTTPKDVVGGIVNDNQTATEALKEAFIELADKLYEKKIFDYIYLICGPDKSYLADNIIKNSKRSYFINCSKKDLGGIILALKNSNFLVGNNSGPLNLAAALNVRSFGLIANDPVDELKFSKIDIITPQNYDNIRCREREGMRKLSVERVFTKILDYLNQ